MNLEQKFLETLRNWDALKNYEVTISKAAEIANAEMQFVLKYKLIIK